MEFKFSYCQGFIYLTPFEVSSKFIYYGVRIVYNGIDHLLKGSCKGKGRISKKTWMTLLNLILVTVRDSIIDDMKATSKH